jgi:uncharacterized membrane protein
MYIYTFTQWLLFFYFYSMVGWLWESCYVSLLDRKWVNRGFLNGPFLPIYGFGAVIILLVTIPVRESFVLIFLFGMTGATVLEYSTGALMEKLFHVRYWDYSSKAVNLNGYICLVSSFAWGGFSILLVKVLHRPVEHIILLVPATLTEIIAFILTTAIVVDITESFRDAMDLKRILTNWKENNAEIKRIEKRLDVLVAVFDNDIRALRSKAEDNIKTLESGLADNRKKYERILAELKGKVEGKLPAKEVLLEKLENFKKKRTINLSFLLENINLYLEEIGRHALGDGGHKTDEYDSIRSELKDYKDSIHQQEADVAGRKSGEYLRTLRLLGRNPRAASRKFTEALAEIKDLLTRDNK